MAPIAEIQELSIALVAPDNNPTLLNPGFLVASGIVPNTWEVSREPVVSARGSQIAFKNGVSFLSKPGSITIAGTFNQQQLDQLQVAAIAAQYAEKLPNLTYKSITINPRRFVPFADAADGAEQYITRTLLKDGAWQQFGAVPVRASLNLAYPLDQTTLQISITPAQLKASNSEESTSVVVFSGSFSYVIDGDRPEIRMANLNAALQHWQRDLESFQQHLDTKFGLPQTSLTLN